MDSKDSLSSFQAQAIITDKFCPYSLYLFGTFCIKTYVFMNRWLPDLTKPIMHVTKTWPKRHKVWAFYVFFIFYVMVQNCSVTLK